MTRSLKLSKIYLDVIFVRLDTHIDCNFSTKYNLRFDESNASLGYLNLHMIFHMSLFQIHII